MNISASRGTIAVTDALEYRRSGGSMLQPTNSRRLKPRLHAKTANPKQLTHSLHVTWILRKQKKVCFFMRKTLSGARRRSFFLSKNVPARVSVLFFRKNLVRHVTEDIPRVQKCLSRVHGSFFPQKVVRHAPEDFFFVKKFSVT